MSNRATNAIAQCPTRTGSEVRYAPPIPDVGDQGVDIEAMREGALIAVQCKRYNRPIGTKSVHQGVCAGKTH